MAGTYDSKARRNRHRRGWSFRWGVAGVVLGAMLLLAAGAAYATIILHGRAVLTAPSYREQGLQVSGMRLAGPLQPGQSADLRFLVYNPNAFGVRVTTVSVVGPLRKAAPKGCTAKVDGPALARGGFRLPPAAQVWLGPGGQAEVLAPGAFRLARSARAGCGFAATLDVAGVAAVKGMPSVPPTEPTAPPPPATTAPTSSPPPPPPVPTTAPPSPPPILDDDTDPADVDPPPAFG